mmetsp:Transcript_7183/g.25650  ORF Transcript_7183/g.25650 Transcript_7183/m.25650 type:complete len:364 (-) Transcript_7183:1494-2585(-)
MENQVSITSELSAHLASKCASASSRCGQSMSARHASADTASVMLVAASYCAFASAAPPSAAPAPSDVMYPRHTPRRRRAPTCAPSSACGAVTACESYAALNSSYRRFASCCTANRRARAAATKSMTSPIASPISDTSGRRSASDLRLGSSAASVSVERKAATKSSSSVSSASVLPAAKAASSSFTTAMPSFCDASQRLTASESCAIIRMRSSRVSCACTTLTGAEKSRKSEATGRAATPVNTNVCSASVSDSTRVVSPAPAASAASPSRRSGRSAPDSGSMRPRRTGMWNGSLVGCPGVGGHDWRIVSEKVPAAASCADVTSTSGVPACEYHRSNCVRSMPEASAMAARNSSQLTASPSWRSK